jgi:hypothetical protein
MPTSITRVVLPDDKLLPSTSNTVERGSRCYRKRQSNVYRVRTQAQMRAHLALAGYVVEARAEGRQQTLQNPVSLLQSFLRRQKPQNPYFETSLMSERPPAVTADELPRRPIRSSNVLALSILQLPAGLGVR